MDHVWVIGFFFLPFHCEKVNSRTSKPTVSHRNQQGVKLFWVARYFFNTTCGELPQNTKTAHPGTSIPKKWSVAPQNHLFHIRRNKRWPEIFIFATPVFGAVHLRIDKMVPGLQRKLQDIDHFLGGPNLFWCHVRRCCGLLNFENGTFGSF